MKLLNRIAERAAILAAVLACVLALAPRAAAQSGSISGSIKDIEGKPWPEVTIRAVSDQGAKSETKTDKDGKFSLPNLRSGIYTVYIVYPPPNDKQQPYEVKARVSSGDDAKVDLNFQDIVAKQGAAAQEQVKKQEEAKSKLEGLKARVTAGDAIVVQERQARTELQNAKLEERDAAKQKLQDLSNQAVTEYKEAQKLLGENDNNTALVWFKLGEAYDNGNRYGEAAEAYQQAIKAKPDVAAYYNNLGNVLAKSGKIDEAKAAYMKNIELDPPNAAMAWRNFGISLFTAQRMTEAIEPLKKSTELDPKNAQGWYLLATCMVADPKIYKQVGDKIEVTPTPGTVEAYQKAIELDPNGTVGAQAKQGLQNLQQLTGGIDTKVNMKKKKS